MKKEGIKPTTITILVALFTIVVVLVVMFKMISNLNSEIQDKKIKLIGLEKIVYERNAEITTIRADLTNKTEELNKVIERMEGIKDVDDLLRRDIFLYIDRKFQLIPKTISQEIANQILKVSKIEKISPELLIGIIQVESAFNPMAISNKNARGLMQVMPEWAKKFKLKYISDLHDIDTNIQYGTKVLKIHIKEGNGSISKGLYYYVGKSDTYAGKVFEAMGRFVAFRSTIDDSDESKDQTDELENDQVESISETSQK